MLEPEPEGPVGRGHRKKKRPVWKYKDMIPSGQVRRRKRADSTVDLDSNQRDITSAQHHEASLPPPGTDDVRMSPVIDPAPGPAFRLRPFCTLENNFGLHREYYEEPPRVPDYFSEATQSVIPPTVIDIINPYPNLSSFRFAHINAIFPKNSQAYEDAIQELLLRADFERFDLDGVNMEAMKKKVLAGSVPWGDKDLGWRESSVTIGIPDSAKSKKGKERSQAADGVEGQQYSVDGFWYRPIVPLLKSVLTSDESRTFHYEPYKQLWRRPGTSDPPVRIFDEMYTADAWLKEHEKIQKIELPPDEPNDYPRAIASLMFWSDSTHLAEFGEAAAWPIYMAFGNQSKYERSKPGAHALHHIGFLPSVRFAIQHGIPLHALINK